MQTQSMPNQVLPNPAIASEAATLAATNQSVELTAAAARRIRHLMTSESDQIRLRISVAGGGCSGFQYSFTLDDQLSGDDQIFSRDGAELVIDDQSLSLMAGAVLDFVEDLAGSSFQIKNPKAGSGCGCGNSFALA